MVDKSFFFYCLFLAQKCQIAESALMITLPVFLQTNTTSYAMIKSDLPALTQFTACFWFNGGPDDDNRTDDWLLSFATPVNDNALNVGFTSTGALTLKSYAITTNRSEVVSWDSKHRHCLVWRDNQWIKWYYDVNTPGALELFRTRLLTVNMSLPAGSTLSVLQEQDSLGGGFSLPQTMTGGIANFNLWNYAMTDKEISTLPCIANGNVVNPSNVQFVGVPVLTTDTYPCFKLKPPATVARSIQNQNGAFCRLAGFMLNNYVLSTVQASTAGKCVMECLKNNMCLSSDYRVSTGACKLNYLRDVDVLPSDFLKNMGNDYIHFTTRQC